MRSKIYIFLFLLICSAGFMACADQDYDYAGSNESVLTPEGKIRVPLNVIFPDFDEVQTRTVNKTNEEKKLHSIGVLVFEASSSSGLTDTDRLLQKNFVNLEAIYGSQLSDKAYVELEPLAEDCYILVYANLSADAQSRLNAAAITLAENSSSPSTWSALKNFGLTLDELYKDATAPGGAYANLSSPYPMSSDAIYLSEITPATTNNLEVSLHMPFARIDVQASQLDDFVLHSVMPVSAERTGNLWHIQNRAFTSDRTFLYGETPVTASGSGIVSPIYIFPTSVPAENDGADSQATDIILKGDYTDTSGKTSYNSYYKIRVRFSVLEKDTYIINPNTLYKINLIDVKGPGYTSLNEAKANKPQNILYDISVDNSNNSASDLIITNGSYYLGVSNSEYHVYSDDVRSELVITTLTHNAPATVINAFVELEGPGLTLVNSGFASVSNNKGFLTAADGTEKKTPIKIAMNPVLFTTGSVGSLTIRLGDLIKKVVIKRKNSITGGFFIAEDFTNGHFVRAEFVGEGTADWVKFSNELNYWEATTEAPFDSPNGNIYCYFLLNSGTATRCASLFFGKNNAEGRLKVDIYQPVATEMTEDLWSIQLTHFNLDAHYDFRPILIRAKKGRSSIKLLDENKDPIDGRPAYDWVRISDALKYPGGTSSKLKTLLPDLNHNINKQPDGYNLSWMMLYADEYIDLTKAPGINTKRAGNLKFCYTVYDDPKLLENDETLSFLPVYKPFDQCNIVNLGYFGGSFDEKGYKKLLGIESREEHKARLIKAPYDNALVPVPWGLQVAKNTSLDNGYTNTITLYNAYGQNPLPENPLDMVHNTYAAAYCMYKNRDLDGNGKIEGAEIKWYLPSRSNMIAVNLFINSDLFISNGMEKDKKFYTSSDYIGNDGQSYIYYNHFNVHYNDRINMSNSTAERIRCVRNLD